MPESGVPHRGGTQVPHHHHFRVNKNGFWVTHLTKMQKEKKKKKQRPLALLPVSQVPGPTLALC